LPSSSGRTSASMADGAPRMPLDGFWTNWPTLSFPPYRRGRATACVGL
jgi:hypothetical protein